MAKKKLARRRPAAAKKKTTRRRGTTKQKGMPIPKADVTAYAFGSMLAGRIVQRYLNIPFLGERAVGLYAYAWVTPNKVVRETLASVAVALQLETVAVDTGVMARLINALPGGRRIGSAAL